MIILIIGHFSTFAKFCGNNKISRKKNKFRGLARYSSDRGKLWTLFMTLSNHMDGRLALLGLLSHLSASSLVIFCFYLLSDAVMLCYIGNCSCSVVL